MNRSDKILIAAAVALALAVLGGLVLWKKPGIFSGSAKNIPVAGQTVQPLPPAVVPPAEPNPAQSFAPAKPAEPLPAVNLPQVGGKLTQQPPSGSITQEIPTPPGMVPEKPQAQTKPISPSDIPSGAPQMPTETMPPAQVRAPAQSAGPSADQSAAVSGQTPKNASSFPVSPKESANTGDKKLEQMFADLAEPTVRKEAPPPGKAPNMPDEVAGQADPAATVKADAPATEPKPEAAPQPVVETKADKRKGKKGKTKEEKTVKVEPAAQAPQAEPKPQAEPTPQPKTETPPQAPKAEAKEKSKTREPAKEKSSPAPQASAGKNGVTVLAHGKVTRVQASEGPTEFTVSLALSSKPTDVKTFFMDNPPRFVFDIVGAYTMDRMPPLAGSGIIRGIRLAEHPGYFRIVMDLAPNYASTLRGRPVIETSPNGVVLRIPHE